MYAVGHTSLRIGVISEKAAKKVEDLAQKKGRVFRNGAIYSTRIKNEKWSFFRDASTAQGFQILLKLDGSQS